MTASSPDALRVAVDGTPLLGPRTGVGEFTASLLGELGDRDDVVVTSFPVSVSGRHRFAGLVPPGVRAVAPALPARLLRRRWQRASTPRIVVSS